MSNFFEAREMVLNEFKCKIFLIKSKGSGILNTKLEILIAKQMLQRLPIALVQVKAGKNSENLLNKSGKLFIICTSQKKFLKKYTIT